MKRNLSFEEISDGKRYKASDCVKTDTHGCAGCHECCETTEDTIFLDPFDIYMLSKATGKTFTEMLESEITLKVTEGLIVPTLNKKKKGPCVFLSPDFKCEIHEYRPGFCRLFPLGRIWNEDGSFDYFIQVHECPCEDKGAIPVREWLSVDEIDKYEGFVRAWHTLTHDIKELSLQANDAALKASNMKMLQAFFIEPYDTEKDFYSQFYSRGF